MSRGNGIKRYEPYSFILYLAMVSMSIVMGFSIYKYAVNLHAGAVTIPVFGAIHYLGIVVSALALALLLVSIYLINRQKFNAFRVTFSLSFYLSLFFLVLQIGNVPRTAYAFQDSGNYFLGFLMAVHSLFLSVALVGQGIILARLSKRISYVDSFIFSVNPPNILNFRLLVRFMVFVFVLWLLVCLFLKSYVA